MTRYGNRTATVSCSVIRLNEFLTEERIPVYAYHNEIRAKYTFVNNEMYSSGEKEERGREEKRTVRGGQVGCVMRTEDCSGLRTYLKRCFNLIMAFHYAAREKERERERETPATVGNDVSLLTEQP